MRPDRAAVSPDARGDRDTALARWISNAIVVVSALLVSVSVFVSFTQPAITKTDQTDWLFNIIIVVGFAFYAAIGCAIVRRQPRNAGLTVRTHLSTKRLPARTLDGATS